ncbi:Fic family protein [Francisella philomiragia]|uniref:Fic family protein n=1 Tax=Francisella philomiragia TaxID=28110 RepID=UPI001907D304|nr:Fic family protein [Francisella philomiragia]MBK2256160.1 Fic family protein [Francisella philomiragia]MBK2266510.1 Fic family protein [Francisella philomiragia]MBK2268818.1 Fic family protein [Francisella philomiragia]MBK2270707.1 Fic family protein [Francisella philomiragia]MBK2274487.1 Fic family protein [Francisella philomiragia]
MNLKNFKSGTLRQEYQYKSFLPEKINHTFTWDDPQINTMLENATRALGELNAFTMIVPNVDIFIQMHIAKEANTSSKIEGTKTEMDEVLVAKEQIDPEKRDDWQEVHNYIEAMNHAIKELDSLPISNRLIKNIHAILLNSVRGEAKLPGEFRKSQNWIGGASLATAYFIPPHFEEVNELMSDLEKFLHNEEIFVPHLIKIAIAHYQFETIHPFLDGNGRIGRLLITLYLVSNGLLKKPSLYLSDFIEKNKSAYYEALTRVRTDHDLVHWIKFFLEAVITTANSGVDTFKRILSLKNEMDSIIVGFGKKAHNASKLIEYLYQKPIISINEILEPLDISSKSTANSLVKEFEKKGILVEVTGYERNKLFAFEKYLSIYSKV